MIRDILKKGLEGSKGLILVLAAAVLMVIPSASFAYTIDGNLAEWGITPGAYGASDWAPNTGIYYALEDNDPSVSYLGPGYGGQYYDAEAMYVDFDSTNIYFAVVTGFPSAGLGSYMPGDLAFDAGIDGSYEYGIDTTGNGTFTKGSLYSVPLGGWGSSVFPGHSSANPTEMLAGSLIYNPPGTNLVYNQTYYSATGHYVIEGFMPYSYFGSDVNNSFRLHWTMTCGNDFIDLDIPIKGPIIPEPATLSLFGLGLLGLFGLRKKIK